MTNAVLFFLAVSNVLAWFVIGRHSSTLGAHRRNNIQVWKAIKNVGDGMATIMKTLDLLKKWNMHQDRVMVETLHGLMTMPTSDARGTKKKGSQKVKITRK